MKEDVKGITVKKSEDFSEWYTQVVQKAELADIRFGIQGFIVHQSWGFKIIRKIYEYLEKEIEDDNHEPFLFPISVKEKDLMREKEHAGFNPEVFWVSEAGSKKIEERFALRPTGEAQIYPIYSLWIRSHNDLPFKGYQSRISVFRNEKTTRPFLRGREFLFFESHDVFSTHEDALTQVEKDLKISKKVIYDIFNIPFLFFKRPQWDKFKGAMSTFTPDTLMPDGKRNQLASTHDLGQNFSKAFNIKFIDKDEKEKYAWQTCFGPGIWRIMAATIGIHGDDKGLILPFKISPIQIVIIPITFSKDENNKDKIKKRCIELSKRLKNFRVKIDDSNQSPGFKYNYWDLKGVPIRLEIGPKELDNNSATLVKRTDGQRFSIKMVDLKKEILNHSKLLNEKIKKNADDYFKNKIKETKSFEELIRIINNYKGFIKVPFCSVDFDGEKCADILKEKTNGGNVCGTIYPKEDKLEKDDKCIVCGKKAKNVVYIAKSY